VTEHINPEGARPAGFTVFRFAEGRQHMPGGPPQGLTEVSAAGLARLMETRMGGGAESRVLFETPGFSVMYVWFKSGFPLYRHSHGPDCLYEVIGGSLQMGEEVLRKGDGFFVPAGTPYAFTPGPEGVEILEFRHEPIRDTVIHANNPAYWDKAVETVAANAERWSTEARPAG
jgi:hypothetical protein